ncbi:hypothetical protein V1264_002160 [Littorina saxatilis]|uniref:Uncharacterized protein n=3 Tax=Littorina saxatilis TaxID=31220 RepID=A0AAN9C3F9_9CAEN
MIICRSRCPCLPQKDLEVWGRDSDWGSQKALTRSLYAMGLVPKTVLRLRHEELMNEWLLLHLPADAINRLGSSITIGQLEILRVHRTDIRLVRWLLDNEFSESDVRKVLVEAENFTNIDAVRNSLNETNTVAEDAANKLCDELREHEIVPASKKSKRKGKGNPKVAQKETPT